MAKAWLSDLEERVRQASKRLRKLTAENRKLKKRVKELEKRLSAAPGDAEKAAWTGERDEIRQRVETLVEHLDGLLEDE